MNNSANLRRWLTICAVVILASAPLLAAADAPASTQPAGNKPQAAKHTKQESARSAATAPLGAQGRLRRTSRTWR